MRLVISRYHKFFIFFNDTATTEIYTLSLHDALPISPVIRKEAGERVVDVMAWGFPPPPKSRAPVTNVRNLASPFWRSEEHTSELQSRQYLVCRLLLEKKKKYRFKYYL